MDSSCQRCGRPTLPDSNFCRFCGASLRGAMVVLPASITEAEEIRRGSVRRRIIAEEDYATSGHESAVPAVLGTLLAVAIGVIFYLLYQARGTHFVFTFR